MNRRTAEFASADLAGVVGPAAPAGAAAAAAAAAGAVAGTAAPSRTYVLPSHKWSTPSLEGPIMKLGKMGFKERWGVFQFNKLWLFKKKPLTTKDDPECGIHLTWAKWEPTEQKGKLCICVTERDTKTQFFLATEPPSQMDLWIQQFRGCQPPPKLKSPPPAMRTEDIIRTLAPCLNQADPRDLYAEAKLIGKGRNSLGIYSAKDLRNNRMVAIKMIQLGDLEKGDGLKYFISEVLVQHRLSGHPNVTKLFEVFYLQGENQFWVILEFMDLGPLHGHIKKVKGNETKIAYVLREVLRCLAFMHSNDLMHRDIKSDNILLGQDGSVKMGDFGFVGMLDKVTRRRYTKCGTVFWMSPEMIEGYSYGPEADVYSFGILAMELAEGLPPYMDKPLDEAAILLKHSGAPLLKGKYSTEFRSFLTLACAYDPAHRGTCVELLNHPFITACKVDKLDLLK